MARPALLIALFLVLSACDRASRPPPPEPVEPAVEEDAASKPVSIIREDVIEEAGAELPVAAEPRRLTIGFPDGGADLDESARAALDELVDEELIAGDARITIWGHSDSIGSDAVNQRAARRRAEAVAAYLEEKGIAPGRIRIVSLGEHNPIAPNKKLDGSDDEEGQAKNRRVEMLVETAGASAPDRTGDKAPSASP